jgi:hypothetical protein
MVFLIQEQRFIQSGFMELFQIAGTGIILTLVMGHDVDRNQRREKTLGLKTLLKDSSYIRFLGSQGLVS